MNYFKNILFFLACLIGLTDSAQAQDERFTASANPQSVGVGDQLQVTFTLNANGRNFRAPQFQDFNVLMGPSQSTQMQVINGSVSQTLSFTYILQAIKEGTFKIGSAEIYAGANKLVSNPITVVVTKAVQPQQKSGSNQGNADNDKTYEGKNVFIVAHVDKTTPYLGEGIYVTYKLYTKVTLLNYSIDKLPALSGFWSQDIQLPQQLDFQNENYDGVNYKAAEIKKLILFPQRSGTLSVDPMEGEVVARVQTKRQKSNDPYDPFANDPFFNNPFFNNNVQDIKLKIKSDPIRLTVRNLPAGAPTDFSGAVGKFGYDVTLDKKVTKSNEPVTLRIRISGKGNLKLIEAPKIQLPPDFETYDPKENVSVNATAGGVTGSKTFEYLIIPRHSGTFKIPITPFSFFDLEKKKYEVLNASDLTLTVERGNESSATIVNGVNQSDVQLLGKDIRFIKTKDPNFNGPYSPIYGSLSFYTAVSIPFLFLFGLLLVRRRQQEEDANVGLVKSKRANKVAMKRLSAAKQYLATNKKNEFLDEMFKALWGFIGDKLRIPVSELSKENVSTGLQNQNVPEPMIQQFIDTIDSCEFARFSGSAADSNNELYQKGIDIISKLENTIR